MRKCTQRVIEVYGKEMALEYAEKCPDCNGGHERNVETVKAKADIPVAFYDKKYEAFNWHIYRKDNGEEIDLSMQEKFINSFIRDFDRWEKGGLGLYIWSHTKGSGKTFLASCICNELMDLNAMRTKFVSASNLLTIAQSANRNALDQYERDPIGLLCNCKLLVIDDLGQKETGKEWMADILFRILDERMQHNLVTIITSNIKMSELSVDDRIADRINRLCYPIPLPDYCVRAKEATENKVKLLNQLGLTKKG